MTLIIQSQLIILSLKLKMSLLPILTLDFKLTKNINIIILRFPTNYGNTRSH
jgi:hypothetical protein